MMMINKVIALSIVLLIAASIASAGLTQPDVIYAQQVEAQQPLNQVILDFTYDSVLRTYSLGGISAQQLKLLGAPELSPAAWDILSRFNYVTLEINNEELSIKTEGEKLASMVWDESSRQVLYDLASEYVAITASSKARAEEWAGFTNIVLNFRNSSQVSRPLQIELGTLLQVDIFGDSNKVIFEGFDTGIKLQPVVSSIAKSGGVENATICWNKGQLVTQVNGKELPAVTVYQEGLDILNEALNLGLGYTSPYFDAKVGADVSFDGAEHSGIYCEK